MRLQEWRCKGLLGRAPRIVKTPLSPPDDCMLEVQTTNAFEVSVPASSMDGQIHKLREST